MMYTLSIRKWEGFEGGGGRGIDVEGRRMEFAVVLRWQFACFATLSPLKKITAHDRNREMGVFLFLLRG